MADRPHIRYFSTAFVPVYFGFTTSEEAFKRELARLTDQTVPFVSADAFATTHCIWTSKEPRPTIIVCLNLEKCTPGVACVPAILAHEAVHAVQFAREKMGKEPLGSEAEAYFVQYLVEHMLKALPKGKRRR